MKTIITTAPLITTKLDKLLLSRPMPDLRDSSKTLWRVFQYIQTLIKSRHIECEGTMKKLILLKDEFVRLHERAKIKEEELKEKTTHITQRSFYYFRDTSRYHKGIFGRLRFK